MTCLPKIIAFSPCSLSFRQICLVFGWWISGAHPSAEWKVQKSQIFPHTAQQLPVGQSLIIEDSWSHSDTPHSVGLLWASDQPDEDTCTWQCTTITREKYTCCRRNSNPQSQQDRGVGSHLRPRVQRDWPEGPQGNYECLFLWCCLYGDITSGFELGNFQALDFVAQISKLASLSDTRQVRLG